jgi:hypothetical protein
MKTRANSGLVILAVLGLLAPCGPARAAESSEQIQGIISHWKFDEGSGTTAYDSAGNNDGTLINGPTWTTGHIDGALSFDGVGDYVETSDDSSLEPQNITVGAWVYRNDVITRDTILQKGSTASVDGRNGYLLRIAKSTDGVPDKAQFYIVVDNNNNKISPPSITEIAPNQWYHIAATYDSSNIRMYVNGVEEGTPTGETRPIDYTGGQQQLKIGVAEAGYGSSQDYFDGTMDDVRIYDRALSPEEIQQLYQDGVGSVVALEIIGPNEVPENSSAGYKAIAYYDNNNTSDVTGLVSWAVEPNTYATIDESGILATADIEAFQNVTLLAQYTYGDVPIQADKVITIFPICPTGTALSFDGVDDYVNLGNESSLKPPLPVTFSAWIKLSNLGGQVIVTLDKQRPECYYGVWFQVSSRSRLEGSFGDGRGGGSSRYRRTKEGATVLKTATWYHVAAVVRGPEDTDLYINGADDGGSYSGTGGALSYSETDAFIGCTHGSATYFHGKIDEVAIYNRDLSPEEIRATMHTRLNGDEPGLLGYWDFDEGEGQIVYDLSGNGNDGQLGSTPNPDAGDPAWVESDAPIGVCSHYQIATMATERALERKTALLEELLAALAEEWAAHGALEELLESGDYGDLNKGDIVTAKQKIHSAIQHQEQAIDALEKSIEKLKDALNALGYEPEPPVSNQPPNVNITRPQDGAEFTPSETIEIEANAWDVDGSVVKVEFFANGSKIDEDNDGADGWETNWYDHPVGTYSLTAKATDNDGAATTSPAVEIMVVELPPPPPPGQASNPNPADGATGVGRNTDLSWTAGSNAVSHNVYFGTTGPGTFRGNQTATTFDPGTMDTYTTYYWRIDEVNPGGTTTGTVWSFRTGNGGPPPM